MEVQGYVALMVALQRFHLENGHAYFNNTFKLHWLMHMIETAKCLHPSWYSTFSDEDFMAKTKILILSCTEAPPDSIVFSRHSKSSDLRFHCVRLEFQQTLALTCRSSWTGIAWPCTMSSVVSTKRSSRELAKKWFRKNSVHWIHVEWISFPSNSDRAYHTAA